MNRSDLQAVLSQHFTLVEGRSTQDELVIICPEPGCGDHNGNRSINVKSLRTNCWRCGKGGRLGPWAHKLGVDLNLGSSQDQAATVDELDVLLGELDKPKVRPSGYVPSVELPRGFTRLDAEQPGAYHKLIGRMAVRKGLRLEDLEAAGVGFTRVDRRWEPYAIFPCYEWGRPVYYQGRTYVDTPGESTKLFPTRHECPLSSRYWIYNIDKLRGGGKVALVVEAVLSVLSLEIELARRGIDGVVPVAVYKHHISADQHTKLLTCDPAEVCLMYDGDSYGQAVKDALSFVNATKASAVQLYNEKGHKDPNDDPAAAVDLFLRRRLVSHLTLSLD